jgi:type IV secretory pathway VirB3-like protein
MEKSAVILGLSRQAKFLGLPMPYAMAVGAATVLPFILFKPVWWFLTAPIWYGLARMATKVNPNGHHVFAVMMQVTPIARKVQTADSRELPHPKFLRASKIPASL